MKKETRITKEDVEYIASLSRIHLQEGEIDSLKKNLEKILHYMAKLEKPDTREVPPTAHVLSLKNVYRQDSVRPSLKQEEALKIAVEQRNGAFKVPKVIE